MSIYFAVEGCAECVGAGKERGGYETLELSQTLVTLQTAKTLTHDFIFNPLSSYVTREIVN